MKKMRVSIKKDGSAVHEMQGYEGDSCYKAADAVKSMVSRYIKESVQSTTPVESFGNQNENTAVQYN